MNEGGEGCGCLTFLIILAILYFLFTGGGGICEYEGRTAEEWFNAYDYQLERYEKFRSCVEDYDSLDTSEQIGHGGVFYYCE